MREEIILYHGSKNIVESPEIRVTKYNKDFYFGFYCTNIEKQAERWATRYGEKGYINRYEYTENTELKILKFEKMTEEWLDFILNCRSGQDGTDYDLVVGGVANDKVFNTVELYFDGFIDKAEAIKRLQYEKPNLQIAFRTTKALSYLKFEGSEKL